MFALEYMVSEHHYMSDWVDGAVGALRAGVSLDLNYAMPINLFTFLTQAVNTHRIDASEVFTEARRLFLMRLKLGEFDGEHVPFNYSLALINSPEHRNLSLRAAKRGLVLLKNEQFLPLGGRPLPSVGRPLPSVGLPLPSVTLLGPFATTVEQLYGDYAPTPNAQWTTTVAQGVQMLLNDRRHMQVVLGCEDAPCVRYDRTGVLDAVRKEEHLIILTLGIFKGLQLFWQ